ncbi:MAG: hypothetical protein RLZZ338_2282, partial [Cyanobacteriota bacterium]
SIAAMLLSGQSRSSCPKTPTMGRHGGTAPTTGLSHQWATPTKDQTKDQKRPKKDAIEFWFISPVGALSPISVATKQICYKTRPIPTRSLFWAGLFRLFVGGEKVSHPPVSQETGFL